MEKRKTSWVSWLSSLILGFLWSYALLTRIDLFFLVPLWFKAILWGITSIIFSFLIIKLGQIYQRIFRNKPTRFLIPIIAVLLTSALFIFLPYQRVAFKTTHNLVIETSTSDIEMAGIFSPDHNYIDPGNFAIEGTLKPDEELETGFVLSPQTRLTYQNSFLGGLYLGIDRDSGPITVTWDGLSESFDLEHLASDLVMKNEGWSLTYDKLTSQYELSLPGNTWGNPDLFWSILGGLLPVSDFVGLSLSIILAVITIAILITKDIKSYFSKGCFYGWAGFSIAVSVIRFGFEGQIPNITSWLGAIIFVPPALYLIYIQLRDLQNEGLIAFPQLDKVKGFGAKVLGIIQSINKNKTIAWICIVLIALIGTGVLFILTQDGMGVSGDSVHYMDGAANLAAGLGYVRRIVVGTPDPITGFPPGFPLAILPGILLGSSPESSARVLNLILYFFYILLSGGFVLHFTQKGIPAICISALSITFISMESIFGWAMSEPLFIVAMLGIMALALIYFKTKNFWMLILMGLASGYLLLVRLAGLSLIGAIALMILITSKEKVFKKLGAAFLYGFLSILPTLAFLYRNSRVGNSISESRGLNFAIFKSEYWQILFNEISSWFKLESIFREENIAFIVLGVITLSIIAFYIYLRVSKKISLENLSEIRLLDLILIFITLYFVMIILNVVIFTPDQTISGLSRYTLPLYPVFMIFAAIVLSRFVWSKKIYPINLLVTILLVILIQLSILEYLDFNRNVPKNFRAYTDIITTCKDNLDVFENLPDDAEIYSNNCDFVYYASGISCNHLPLGYESYHEGSELFKTIENGNIVAIMDEYGGTPVNLNVLIKNLDPIDHQCMITFYKWKSD